MYFKYLFFWMASFTFSRSVLMGENGAEVDIVLGVSDLLDDTRFEGFLFYQHEIIGRTIFICCRLTY